MSSGLADTSVFIATEAGRPLGELPELLAVSVITLAELEMGVLHAGDAAARGRRLATLSRVRDEVPAIAITAPIASLFAALSAEMHERGARAKIHDTWIASTAVHLDVPVYTQDSDFDAIPRVTVFRV